MVSDVSVVVVVVVVPVSVSVTFTLYSTMWPFWRFRAGVSQLRSILVEFVADPMTFSGAPSGAVHEVQE